MTGGRRGRRELLTGPSPYAPSFGSFRLCLVVRVREDVALELGSLDLGGDLRAFRGRVHVADFQFRDRGIDPGQLLFVAVGLSSLRHGTSSTPPATPPPGRPASADN